MAVPEANEVVERAFSLNLLIVFGKTVTASGMLPSKTSSLPTEELAKVERTVEKIAEKLLKIATRFCFLDYLTIEEKRTIVTPFHALNDQALLQATWRIEAFQIMLWALHSLEKIPHYDMRAEDALLNLLPIEKFEEFRGTARLRDLQEIEAAREQAELWHWRCRTRQLIERGEKFPVVPQFKSFDDVVRATAKQLKDKDLIPVVDEDFCAQGKAIRDLSSNEFSDVFSIAFERHLALNWLCGRAPQNNWDRTPTDT